MRDSYMVLEVCLLLRLSKRYVQGAAPRAVCSGRDESRPTPNDTNN
jgi:hypothetical protein